MLLLDWLFSESLLAHHASHTEISTVIRVVVPLLLRGVSFRSPPEDHPLCQYE